MAWLACLLAVSVVLLLAVEVRQALAQLGHHPWAADRVPYQHRGVSLIGRIYLGHLHPHLQGPV